MPSSLWHVRHDDVCVTQQITPAIVAVSAPFARFGLIKFGARVTITRLQSGALMVFSPIPLNPAVQNAVKSLGGNVQYLVAPDIEHHMALGPWKKEFPQAKVISIEGLREKRAKQKDDDVPIDFEYKTKDKATMQLPEDLASEFDVEYMDGHTNQELVFNHRPSRTLIQADLLFNLPGNEQYSRTGEPSTSGIFTKIGLALGVWGLGKGQQRFQWYVGSSKDRKSFDQSINRIVKWDFDRIIPCHGDVIESGGKNIFKQVFAWHLRGQAQGF